MGWSNLVKVRDERQVEKDKDQRTRLKFYVNRMLNKVIGQNLKVLISKTIQILIKIYKGYYMN